MFYIIFMYVSEQHLCCCKDNIMCYKTKCSIHSWCNGCIWFMCQVLARVPPSRHHSSFGKQKLIDQAGSHSKLSGISPLRKWWAWLPGAFLAVVHLNAEDKHRQSLVWILHKTLPDLRQVSQVSLWNLAIDKQWF